MDLQNKTIRELNNIALDLNVKMANIDSDLKKLSRGRSEHELATRRLRREIQQKEMKLDELKLAAKRFDKDEFEFINNKRILKKRIQEVMAVQRRVE